MSYPEPTPDGRCPQCSIPLVIQFEGDDEVPGWRECRKCHTEFALAEQMNVDRSWPPKLETKLPELETKGGA